MSAIVWSVLVQSFFPNCDLANSAGMYICPYILLIAFILHPGQSQV